MRRFLWKSPCFVNFHPPGRVTHAVRIRYNNGNCEGRERHVAGTQWGCKKYMNMKHLEAALDDASIAG